MAQVSSVDYDAKRIHLHSDTVVNGFDVIAAYFEINALVKANANGEQNRAPCLSAEGKIPKGGGKFTPRYGLLEPGWRIVPYNGVSHVLAINVEVLSPDGGGLSGRDVFDRTPLPPSIEVQIDHNWDQVELIEVNTGGTTPALDPAESAALLKILEVWQRLDLDAAKPNVYADNGSSIANADYTLTKTSNGDGTSTVQRS